MSNENTTPLSLIQAVSLDRADWANLGTGSVRATGSEMERLELLWLYLHGESKGSKYGPALLADLRGDAEILTALAAPARDALAWFVGEDWDTFEHAERTGSVEWGYEWASRAWAIVKDMGHLAGQMPLRVPMVS